MRRLRALGLDEVVSSRRPRPACRSSACASGCSCCSTAPTSTRARTGLGLLRGRSRAARHARPEVCRTSAGTPSRWQRPSALIEGLPDPAAFYHVHSYRGRARRPLDRARDGRVRLAVRAPSSSTATSSARSAIPRSPPSHGLALLRNFVGHLRDGAAAVVILYPAIDIAGGRAVRLVQGDFDAETVYDDEPASRPRAHGSMRARATCTSSTSTARGPARRRTCTTSSASPASSACRSSTAAGCARSRPSRDAIAAGAARVILGTAAFSDVDFLDEVVAALRRADRRQHRHARRLRLDRRLDARRPRCPPRAVIERLQDRGVRAFVFTNVDKDGLLGGPRPRRGARRSPSRRARALHVLRRDRRARGPRRARGAARS